MCVSLWMCMQFILTGPYCVLSLDLTVCYLYGAEPGDRVEVDETIAQVETDKVFSQTLQF